MIAPGGGVVALGDLDERHSVPCSGQRLLRAARRGDIGLVVEAGEDSDAEAQEDLTQQLQTPLRSG